jgi:hypothetical protein
MDEKVKVAASYLYQAVSGMQARISEIRQSEYMEGRQESREEDRIIDELHRDEVALGINAENINKDQHEAAQEDARLISHDRDLRSHRNQVKDELKQRTAQYEKEIRFLQDQINKVNELGHTLENWRG